MQGDFVACLLQAKQARNILEFVEGKIFMVFPMAFTLKTMGNPDSVDSGLVQESLKLSRVQGPRLV